MVSGLVKNSFASEPNVRSPLNETTFNENEMKGGKAIISRDPPVEQWQLGWSHFLRQGDTGLNEQEVGCLLQLSLFAVFCALKYTVCLYS